MTCNNWTAVTVWEGSSLKVMARLVDVNNVLITRAAVSSIRYRVVADDVEVVALTTLTVADVVFDTLQTTADDAAWTKDSGYNFRYIFPPSTIPNGGTTYYIPIEFTDASSRISYCNVKVTTNETYVDTPPA